MNSMKICFIICANDELYLGECVRYIQWLHVPKGMEVEILEIRDAVSMTAGYNEGMKCSDAKYKVYLHQDVFIKNRNFISDIISIFQQDIKIGMIGLVGSERLPVNGVMWSGKRVMYGSKLIQWEEYQYNTEDGYWEVACVDGLLMATQYDVEWREDLFSGWDFYDISQSFEMRRHGFKVVVPVQNNAWYIHDDKVVLQLWNYNKNRKIFLEEYRDDMKNYGKQKPLLEFQESFFGGEEREGFFVESDMKHAWAAQMEVLAEIDKICKENGIRYFADYGTLLGAVRHKGFIPWDDDIDICMLREDYQRFHELAKRKLPKGCHLESCYIAKEWNLPFIRIVNALRLPIEKVMIEKYHGCPYVVGVDIFPIDNVPDEQAEEDVLKNAYGGLAAIGELMKQGKSLEEIEEDLQRVEEYLNIKINRKGNVINQVMRMLDNIACIYQHDDCKKVASMIFYAGNREQVRLKEWYRDSMLMPFENIQIPVPVGYEEVLQNLYGDWRRIVRNVAGHSYPFYKEQREYLKNKNL